MNFLNATASLVNKGGPNYEKKFAKWTGEKFVPCDKIGRMKEG